MMKKQKIIFSLFLLLIFSVFLFLSGCSSEEKENTKDTCKVDSDCAAKTCQKATCSKEKVCKYTPKDNCCGNNKCDLTENSCSCKEDCKPACEGQVQIGEKSKKPVYAKYLEQKCDGEGKASTCEVIIDEQFTTPQTVTTEKKLSDIKFGITTTYAKVIDPTKANIKVTVKIIDDSPNLIFPVTIKSIKLLSGQLLLGQKDVDEVLTAVGEETTQPIKISYKPSICEEEKQVSIKIDYEYNKKISSGEDLQRLSLEEKLAEKIGFVKTGEPKEINCFEAVAKKSASK
ncbi:hypothetical protein HZA96_05905 [Candidatus Woesearchaeota archaeon]|nr:hypothetical protein [Candidatus Woesearchaeota archaeon]